MVFCKIQATCVKKVTFDPLPAKVIYLNFHPLEVGSRYRNPQLPTGWELLIFVKFETKRLQILMFNVHFLPNNADFIG